MSRRKTPGRLSRESGNFLDRARSFAESGKDIIEMPQCPGESILRAGLQDIALSLGFYRDLIDMTDPASTLYETILRETRETVKDAYSLINKIRFCREVPGSSTSAELTRAMERMSLTEGGGAPAVKGGAKEVKVGPLCADIPTESPEDEGIVRKICGAIIRPECSKPLRTFDDYVGSKELREFFTTVAIDRYKYKQFEDAHPNTESILLFGPPGTGKTLLAEAVAAELLPLGATFISISASDIKGRFVGESEKGIKYLFAVARELTRATKVGGAVEYGAKPVVIFMDEIDGLIEEAGSGGASTGLLAEFNAQVAGFKAVSNKGLIIIAATNYPEKMPPAAFQRFTHRIFIGLPSLDNIREKLMKDLKKKFGWDRINFSETTKVNVNGKLEDRYPLWLRQIDWEREKFITNYLEISNASSPFAEWSYPGQFDVVLPGAAGGATGGPETITTKVSKFLKIATQSDIDDPRQILSPGAPGKAFVDVLAGGDNSPWDAVDFMSYLLWTKYYAPREIDGIFLMMLIKAEQKSVVFATQNPTSQNKVYYQKWLLEKSSVTKKIAEGNRCVEKPMEPRFSFIPLWYTVGDEGRSGENEKTFLERFSSNIEDVKFGEAWGYKRTTFTKPNNNGSWGDRRLEPKFNLKDKKNETKIVVSKTEVTDIVPLAQVLLRGKKPSQIRRYFIEKKQITKNFPIGGTEVAKDQDALIASTKEGVIENAPYIPTEKWTPPSEETLNQDKMPRVLGIAQITFSDFIQAVDLIRSIPIKNVAKMIEYAENYGRSVKGGEDIKQLKKQGAFMEKAPKEESSRYFQIWRQFIDAMESTMAV